jgi:hypothetical protein
MAAELLGLQNSPNVLEMVTIAKEMVLTLQGEMYSATGLASLACRIWPSLTCQVIQLEDKDTVLTALETGCPVLVPYPFSKFMNCTLEGVV